MRGPEPCGEGRVSGDQSAEVKLFPIRSNQHLVSEYGGRRHGRFVVIDGDGPNPTEAVLGLPEASLVPSRVHIDIDLDENDHPSGLA